MTLTRRRMLQVAVAGAGTVGLAAGAGEAAPDDYAVGTDSPAATEMARRAAETVRRTLEFGDVGRAVVGQFPPAEREDLRRHGAVRYVEPVEAVRAVGQPTGVGQHRPWGVDRIDADVAHDAGVTGDGVDVAVIDTGIDPRAPDLFPNLGDGVSILDCAERVDRICYPGFDGAPECRTERVPCATTWADDAGHGTHVAGIVAARDDERGVVGVAPDATLHAVKVLNADGIGDTATVAAGLEHAGAADWDVAVLSLGGPPSTLLYDAVRHATARGVVLVAATGNEGPCDDCVSYPAAFGEALGVTATTVADDLAAFSSTGSHVDLAAPGAAVCSTLGGGTASFSGTSMAAPFVAGTAALLRSTGTSAGQSRERVLASASDLGLPRDRQGRGLVDAAAALGLDSSDDGVGDGAGC